MMSILRSPSFIPTCILAGVGVIFLVLVAVLPPSDLFALVGGTAVVIGLVLARMRREAAGPGPMVRVRERG